MADARSPEATLASAAAAADSGEHADAVRLLEQVRERCGRSPAADRASLLLAAVHLDPRFSGGSPQVAVETMAEHLRRGAGPAWAAPLARTLYLEALEKGARAPDPAGLAPEDTDARQPRDEVPAACGDAAAAPDLAPLRVLPSLPGTPMAERLRRLRDRVADLEQELERIRDVLDEP